MEISRVNFLVEKIKEMVLQYPEKTAVKDKQKQYSYKELWLKTQSLAMELKRQGLKKGDRVALFMENNADYVICMLAILLNSGIFVPISSKYPAERICTIVNNCNPILVLLNSDSEEQFGYISKQIPVKIVNIDNYTFEKVIELDCEELAGEDVIYIIYTSGSTGMPKGVAIKWESLENYIVDTNQRLCFDNTSVSLNMTSFCFDGSLTSVFCMLSCGGMLVIAPTNIMRAKIICDLIKGENITDLGCTPVQLSYVADALENDNADEFKIKTIAIGGESFSAEHIKRIFRCLTNVKILNRYGPTETTIVVSSYEIQREDLNKNEPIPIGKPISNTVLYAINGKNERIREGEIGELYIGGIQIMSGYWGDQDLTNSVITETLVTGIKLYRTGDLVTIDDRGNYIFVSRIDDMVKINGYRIYLSEVDKALTNIDGILDSCSIVVSNHEQLSIVSYVICETNKQCCNEVKVKAEILKILPSYMLPKKIHFVNDFPVTNNGKIDRKQLVKRVSEMNE